MTWRQTVAAGCAVALVCGVLLALDASGIGRSERVRPGSLIRLTDASGVFRVTRWDGSSSSWATVSVCDGTAGLALPSEVAAIVTRDAALTACDVPLYKENPAAGTSDNARYV